MAKRFEIPGLDPQQIQHRLDGWVVLDPNEAGVAPRRIAAMIDDQGGLGELERIRARMAARHAEMKLAQRIQKRRKHIFRLVVRAKREKLKGG